MRGRKPTSAESKRAKGQDPGDPILVGRRLTPDDDGFYDSAEEVDVDIIDPTGEQLVPAQPAEQPEWVPPVPLVLQQVDELDDDTEASDMWNHVCRLLIESNLLTEGDLFAVEQFVMATLEARRAFFELRTGGSAVATTNPTVKRAASTTNPAYRVWRDANNLMFKWGETLGFTPQARARLGLAIGKGRKLAQELDHGLPTNPLTRQGNDDEDIES